MKPILYVILVLTFASIVSAFSYPYAVPTCGSCRPSIHSTIGDALAFRVPYYSYQGTAPFIIATPQIPEHAAVDFLSGDASPRDKQEFLSGYDAGYRIARDLRDETSRNPYEAMRAAANQLKRHDNPYDWGFEAGYSDGIKGGNRIDAVRSTLINERIKAENYAKGGLYWNMELWESDTYIGPIQKNTPANPFWGFRYEKGLVCNGKTCTEVNVFY